MTSSAARISVLINEQSGVTPRQDAGEEIQSRFTAAGMPVRLERVRHGGDMAARARQAAGRGDVLVAAGGDGTIGTVAAVAVEANARFGVIPRGTLNHFAKDAGIPLELPEAVQTIVAGHVRDIDVGDLNGRVFVNNASLGIYPRMVWERLAEQRQGRGKWTAFTIAMARTWRRYRMLTARMSIDRQLHVVRTPFIFVGNNEYAAAGFQVGARAALDRGRLSVFVAPECGRFEILALPLRALTTRLAADEKFKCFLAQEVTIELSRHHVSVGLDGEVTVMRPPLHFRVRPAALHLFVPGHPAP
jgi:diacylglycerol kinase family enzyme